jgi:hypothetical protein
MEAPAVLAGTSPRVKEDRRVGKPRFRRYRAFVTAPEKRERRSHFRGKPRPGRRVEISFSVCAPNAPAQHAYTRNIGVGGAFVVTDAPPTPGTALALSIHVPTADVPIEVSGEVRWAAVDPSGMGVRFDSLGVEELLQLNEYFASLTGRDE